MISSRIAANINSSLLAVVIATIYAGMIGGQLFTNFFGVNYLYFFYAAFFIALTLWIANFRFATVRKKVFQIYVTLALGFLVTQVLAPPTAKLKFVVICFSFLICLIIVTTNVKIKVMMRATNWFLWLTLILLLFNLDILVKSYVMHSRGAINQAGISIFASSFLPHLLILTYLYSPRRNIIVIAILAILLLGFTAISRSRGPVLALIGAVFLYYLLRYGLTKKALAFLIFSPLAALFVFSLFRRGNEQSERAELLSSGVQLYLEAPLGSGLGSFESFYGFAYPHNLLVEYLIELGPFFTIAFVLTTMYLLLLCFHKRKLLFNRFELTYPVVLLVYFLIWYQFSGSATEGIRIILPLLMLAISKIVRLKEEAGVAE